LKSKSSDVSEIKKLFVESKGNDSEKKIAFEHALRDLIMKDYFNNMEMIEKLIEISISIAKLDCISPYQPVTLLVDVFDTKTLDLCEELFNFVEKNVSVFKEELFFTLCKNNLLRMCNDLLRRLSRSQNTVFCGRILLFLAKFFPFSERSGLNIISEFNVENTTEYGTEENVEMTSEESPLKVDRHLYTKFWSLQEFFRCPTICYDQAQWKKFISYSKEILAAFKSFKLEETTSTAQTSSTDVDMLSKNEKTSSDNYFAKFLTNSKLLSLQLGDSNFRRTILVQYLILFQYLCAPVKFKSDKDQLNTSQQEWVQETEALIYKLIGETPPNGKEFVESVKHLLKREEMWNSWKNDSCKEIQRPEGNKLEPPKAKRQRMLGDVIADATKSGKFELGNPELNRLWNLCPDNLQACKGSDRNFLPPLETYLEMPKETRDPTYEWRALRLVSRQSSHFFTNIVTPASEKIESVADYLKFFRMKILKEKGEIKVESQNAVELQMEQTENFTEDAADVDNGDSQDQPENVHKTNTATSEQMEEISKALGNDWEKLGLKLGLTSGKKDLRFKLI
jgi:THO complex subunit 1